MGMGRNVYGRIAHGAKCLVQGETSMDLSPHVHAAKRLWANHPWGEMFIREAKTYMGELSVGRKVLTGA